MSLNDGPEVNSFPKSDWQLSANNCIDWDGNPDAWKESSQVPRTRRSILRWSLAGITPLGGCQALIHEERPRLDIKVGNYTERAQPVKLTLLRENENDSEGPVVLSREYTVPAPETSSESAGTIHKIDVVPRRRYLVRVQLKYGGFERSHANFYPSHSDEDVIDIRIRRDERTGDLFIDYRFLQ